MAAVTAPRVRTCGRGIASFLALRVEPPEVPWGEIRFIARSELTASSSNRRLNFRSRQAGGYSSARLGQLVLSSPTAPPTRPPPPLAAPMYQRRCPQPLHARPAAPASSRLHQLPHSTRLQRSGSASHNSPSSLPGALCTVLAALGHVHVHGGLLQRSSAAGGRARVALSAPFPPCSCRKFTFAG